jgi:hypothetical protein
MHTTPHPGQHGVQVGEGGVGAGLPQLHRLVVLLNHVRPHQGRGGCGAKGGCRARTSCITQCTHTMNSCWSTTHGTCHMAHGISQGEHGTWHMTHDTTQSTWAMSSTAHTRHSQHSTNGPLEAARPVSVADLEPPNRAPTGGVVTTEERTAGSQGGQQTHTQTRVWATG